MSRCRFSEFDCRSILRLASWRPILAFLLDLFFFAGTSALLLSSFSFHFLVLDWSMGFLFEALARQHSPLTPLQVIYPKRFFFVSLCLLDDVAFYPLPLSSFPCFSEIGLNKEIRPVFPS